MKLTAQIPTAEKIQLVMWILVTIAIHIVAHHMR